jgi:hypothetical protein
MKNKYLLVLMLCAAFGMYHSQNKWNKNLVVKYKTLDTGGVVLNSIVITSDTLFYEWTDKKKPVKRKFLMNDTLAGKIQEAMNKYKVWKFKCAVPTQSSQNVFFNYDLNGKTKLIIFKQPIKPGSKQENFMKEFLEPILVLVFQQELKGLPK